MTKISQETSATAMAIEAEAQAKKIAEEAKRRGKTINVDAAVKAARKAGYQEQKQENASK